VKQRRADYGGFAHYIIASGRRGGGFQARGHRSWWIGREDEQGSSVGGDLVLVRGNDSGTRDQSGPILGLDLG
jgi:hypothetical protein